METLKKIVNSFIFIFIVEVAAGVLLLVNPSVLSNAVSYVLGGIFLVLGLLGFVTYFKTGGLTFDLIEDILLCAGGIFLIAKPEFIFKIFAVIFGIYMIAEGITSIRASLMLKNVGVKWQMSVIVAALSVILGIIILLYPFASFKFAIQMLGVSLIFSGACSIYNGVLTKKKIKRVNDEANNDIIDIK
ncbi:MAG: HdeD family acid-resistance protein [Oscillospiraceae bacterium]